MKFTKRYITMILTVAMLLTIFVIPASAVSSSTLRSKMTNLPYLYHGVSNTGAVRALQRFLTCDKSATYPSALYSDGLDGGFGPTVERAVRNFQKAHGDYGPNGDGTGEVASTTWGLIADSLDGSSGWLRDGYDEKIYRVQISGSTYSFYFYNPEVTNPNKDGYFFATVY